MFWLPPVRFSTTTGWFQLAGRFCASVRAMVSGEPPGGSGTMIFSGRSGNVCAAATEAISAASAATSQRFTISSSMLRRPVYLLTGAAYDRFSAHFTEEEPQLSPRKTLIAVALAATALPATAQQDAPSDPKAFI